MELRDTRRLKLAIEGRDVGGLELLPKLQDGRKILFRSINGCKLGGGRGCVSAVEFAVQACDRPRAAPERRRSGGGSCKTSAAAPTTQKGPEFLVKLCSCLSQRPRDFFGGGTRSIGCGGRTGGSFAG